MSNFFLLGMGNPLQSPAQLLVLFGLGLLLGQQGMRHLRVGTVVFLMAVVAGLWLTRVDMPVWRNDVLLLVLAGVAGGLLALRLNLPLWWCALLAGVGGVFIGLDSAPALIPGIKALKVYLVLAGTATSASLAVVLLALPGLALRTLLDGIILRVLGSWVTASALMVLALMFKQ